MKYYLISSEEFNANHANCEHAPAWSLDNSKCILEVEDTEVVQNYIRVFNDAGSVNQFRYSGSEAQNWIPTEEF
jgi:hypothetical protein